MAKRRNEKTISLFPFLAVLVCTMGALILLLLVTTRRIRQKQHEAPAQLVVSEPAERLTDSIAPEASVPGIAPREWVEVQTTLTLTQTQRAELQQALNVEQQRYTTALQQLTYRQREVTELQHVLKAARQKQETASSRTDAAAQQLAELRKLQDSLQQRRNESAAPVEQLSAALEAAESLAVAAEQLVSERHSALRTLRDMSTHQQDQPADTGVAPTVIEFSNSAGTSRTPIVVDVTDHGFAFPATQIKIPRKDMDGVSLTDNPLLSGVLAVHRERSKDSLTSRPYVLLLVRPGGTLLFYVAQRVFQEAHIHFGYELVCDDQVIAAAQAVDGEAEAVRIAVLNSLIRREKYLDAVSSLRPRITALRGAQAEISRSSQFGSNGLGQESHRQYFEEPSGNSRADGLVNNPFGRHDDRAEAETPASPHFTEPDSKLMDDHESLETANASGGPSPSRAAPLDVWQSIPSMAEAKTQVERELAKALAAREILRRSKAQNGFASDDSATLQSAGMAVADGSAGGGSSSDTVPFGRSTDGSTSRFTDRLISYKQVTIYLDPQNYTIVGYRPVALDGQDISQIVRSIAGVLFGISRRNPHLLTEMTMPSAKFVVSPGAHTLYLQLAAQLHRLNIPVASIVSMDPHVTDRSDGFISIISSPAFSLAKQVSDRKELQ